MHKNSVWVAFLLIVVAISLWFVVKGGYSLLAYTRLSTQVPVTIEKWEVKQEKNDRFFVTAHYFFDYKAKEYNGEAIVGEVYPNPWAANRFLEKASKKEWLIWIDPKHPERAVLQKRFPYRAVISALVLLGLTIYFFILGLYVGGKHAQGHK